MPSDATLNKALNKLFGVRNASAENLNKLRSLFVRQHPSVFVERFRLARDITLQLSAQAPIPTDASGAKLRAQQISEYAVIQAEDLTRAHAESVLESIRPKAKTDAETT